MLMKHVVTEVEIPVYDENGVQIGTRLEMVGQDVEMTPEEEAEFLATLPAPPAPSREPTKMELLEQIQALMAKVEALP